MYLQASQTLQLAYKPDTMGVGLFQGRLPRRQLHPASKGLVRHCLQFCQLELESKPLPSVELVFATRQQQPER